MSPHIKENPSTVGLTTGFSLVLDSGHEIQVDLLFNGLVETNAFQKSFHPGDLALVNGYYKTVQRSQGPVRVLVVTAIAVN